MLQSTAKLPNSFPLHLAPIMTKKFCNSTSSSAEPADIARLSLELGKSSDKQSLFVVQEANFKERKKLPFPMLHTK
jgi:hypothetical protein